MKKILVVAPHPDDETLGMGGSLLRHAQSGDELHWMILTAMTAAAGFSKDQIQGRDQEILAVAKAYGFASTVALGLAAAALDALPAATLISKIGGALDAIRPEVVYLPFPGDVHSDHRIAFHAAWSCLKTFRRPYVKRVLCYETVSETDFGATVADAPFSPNVFVDIGAFLERKIEIFKIYVGEGGEFPFPRSELNLRALATWRGTLAGCCAAEAFQLVKECV